MHIDENKLLDRRNIEKNIKSGKISQKDYETFLSKLPDVGEKIFNPEEPFDNIEEFQPDTEVDTPHNKTKVSNKKTLKGK